MKTFVTWDIYDQSKWHTGPLSLNVWSRIFYADPNGTERWIEIKKKKKKEKNSDVEAKKVCDAEMDLDT